MAPSSQLRPKALADRAAPRTGARCVRTLLGALWAATLLSAGAVQAFIDPVVIVPAQPIVGQSVAFSVRIGVCEYFQAGGPSDGTTIFADDRWRTVVVNGSTLQVTVLAFYAPDENACVYPTANFQFSLGALAPGAYRVELYGQAISDPAFRPLIGSAQFVVGAPPAPIPVNHWITLIILLSALAATGVARLRLRPVP